MEKRTAVISGGIGLKKISVMLLVYVSRKFLAGLLLTAFTALCLEAGAQQIKPVTGVVLDSVSREPLVGVTVVEVGTSRGAVTDAGGNQIGGGNRRF